MTWLLLHYQDIDLLKLPTQTCVTFSASINWKEKGCKVIFATNTQFAAWQNKGKGNICNHPVLTTLAKKNRETWLLPQENMRSENVGFHLTFVKVKYERFQFINDFRTVSMLVMFGIGVFMDLNWSHQLNFYVGYLTAGRPLGYIRLMMFNATFNNISVISWRSVLLVEETVVPGENHQPAANRWQILSHNVVLSTLHHEQGSNSQL